MDKLLSKCMKRAKVIYGEKIPERIEKRLAGENKMLKAMGFAGDFYRLSEALDELLPDWSHRYNVGLREGAGAFLISYLCGLSPYNPAEYLGGRFYPEIYYGIIRGRKRKGKDPCFVLDVSADTLGRINEGPDLGLEHAIIRSTGNLTLLEALEKETDKSFFPSAGVRSAKNDDDNIRKAIWLAEKDQNCFWDYVPLAGKIDQIRRLSYMRDINGVLNLSKLIGVLFGWRIWSGYVEEMIRRETEDGTGFDIDRAQIITCPEDAYEYLSTHMKDDKTAIGISLNIRFGGADRKDTAKMRTAKCDDGFIDAAEKVRYLYERPVCVGAATQIKRLAYYWNIDSKAYRRVYDKDI